jgi:hypothetical protein
LQLAHLALHKWVSHPTQAYLLIYLGNLLLMGTIQFMRDRLRAVECPSDIVDQTGGWSRSSVGQNYSVGYQLPVLHMWLKRIE